MGGYIFSYFITRSQLRNIILWDSLLYCCYVVVTWIQFDIATCYVIGYYFYDYYGIVCICTVMLCE
jgi:hypothetical protein